MSLLNTITFLPQVFRTLTNQRFLGATMDQLAGDAVNVPVNGYVGRTFAQTYKTGDNYVPEPDSLRKNYQLEPSVVITNESDEVEFNTGYIDLLKSIENYGGLIDNQQRLFSSESYNYDGHFDYDKFVNYYDYYWLPDGPAVVAVYGNQAPYNQNYQVSRNLSVNGYTFTNRGFQPNTPLILVRGGTYTFEVNQPGYQFWIQSNPGVSGLDPSLENVSTRDVFGVSNNGQDNGTVTFQVPLRSAQDFFILMPITATVDAAVTFKYTDIQNKLLSEFLSDYPEGLDGINNQLQNKTLVFIENTEDDSLWTTPTVAAPYTSLDVASIRPGDIISDSDRVGSWKIDLISVDSNDSDYIIQISPLESVAPREKVFISSGKTYASTQYWLNDNLIYNAVPSITANIDTLYYQDSSNPGFVGEIKLIDNISTPINVETDIVGQIGYTSPNGVVFTNGLKIQFDSLVIPEEYANQQYYVEGVGTGISLLPVAQTQVVESFAQELQTSADYITINRGSQDRNSWSRSNRWFHKDVIKVTSTYNNTAEDFGPNLPGRRPIIEFDTNLQLFNCGKLGKDSVDLITFEETDAFGISVAGTRVQGQVAAIVDGITLAPGHRVVFANDYDINVRNKIWVVTVLPNLGGQNFINLEPADDNPVITGENVLVTEGTSTGNTYRFNGSGWDLNQAKTGLNQAPLFDLVDAQGYSFADPVVYPDSTFAGNKIFNYYPGTGTNDVILGFPLRYQNFNNIGDIVFKNYYSTENFTYVADTNTGATATINCGSGYLVHNRGLDTSIKLNTWVKGLEPSSQYQLFTKFFDGRVLNINGTDRAFVQIDVLPTPSTTIPHLKVYKNNILLKIDTDYELTTYGEYNIIVLLSLPAVGDKIDIAIFSDAVSQMAFYEIPKNLDQNPLNESFETIALGQIRTHYNHLLENTSVSSRPKQDNYLKAQGGTLRQHSSPLVYAMTFLNDPQVNFINGLDLAKKEYSRFKNKFISLCSTLPGLDYNDPVSGVDAILQSINSVKNSSFPWFYSDMVPQGGNYNTLTYTVLNVRQTNYEIGKIFKTDTLSNRAVLIWVNGEQLTLGEDYVFSEDVPSVIFSKEFSVGDVIEIRDYFDTDGNFIPETPTKLGLYPKSAPIIFEDTTYQTPVNVIRGHDGSLTPSFGDFRDNFLLELEKRIYNNIKSDYSKNIINLYNILPGRFRTTEYTRDEFNQVLSSNFLQWTGTNNVDYTTNQWYDANNSWTWNYENFTDSIDDLPLQGSWRAIYQYWYDTDQPNLAPWQMLGFGFKPSWWETRYGPAPYTSGNFTLWEDLEAGYVWNNGDAYIDQRFVRPGLTNLIPVDTAGNLLPPTDINLIKQYNLTAAGNNFVVGHQGPVETAWRRSSDYPFAIQAALAMCKPASYFGTQFDTSRFYVNEVSSQFTNVANRAISPSQLVVNGDTTTDNTVLRTSGYINWIADGIKNIGIDPVEKINSYLKNLSVKLNYKVGGFTDKNLVTVTAEQTAPGTTRAGVIIPDNNYSIYLNKSVPVGSVTYSAVIVQKTLTGYSVTGYDTTSPFFSIFSSVQNSNAERVIVDDATALLYQDSTNQLSQIPYGTTYKNTQDLSDFLISYERYLESVGFVFNHFDADLQEIRNFKTGVKEFLFWSQQGWEVGTIIVLNPIANKIVFNTVGTMVDEIANTSTSGRVLDQNFLPIKSTNFNLVRSESPVNGNVLRITTLDGNSICLAHFKLVQFEHVLIFDNESDFGDIVYVPAQGVRQYRLKLSGIKTGNWTGALSASGYIYSDAKVQDWQTGVDYQVGDIVTFNNSYYTALDSIPAGNKFDVTNWAQIQKSDIKTGLLPNFGQQAQQFENIYDIDQPPNNENLQLFSAGLIGFRPRSYLTDLGISIPNQTKFYQGFIKEKGSLNAISALTKAGFNNVSGRIETFEEWGFRVGQYGDIDGNQYKEFVLDQSVFTTNPVAFTLSDNYSTGNIIVNLKTDSNLLLSNVYNSSNISNITTELYSNRSNTVYNKDLPTAGYVHLEDVDLKIFDINEYNDSPDVGIGSKIWTAKDTTGQWNVYRVTESDILATTLTYVLDDYAQLMFDNKHSLVEGDLFVVKGFNVEYFNNAVLENFSTNYDGVYQVIDVINDLTVTVQIKNQDKLNNLIATSPVVSNASVYRLITAKTDSINSIDSITPLQGWINGDRVWVSNATADYGWGVYTFNKSWPNTQAGKIFMPDTVGDGFGKQIAVGADSNFVYINRPGMNRVEAFLNAQPYDIVTDVGNLDTGFAKVVESQGNLLVVSSQSNVYIYRHNDSTTSNTIASPWVSNGFPTLGTEWTSNTVFADGTQIYFGSNTYFTIGNVYGNTFSLITGNLVQANLIPVNSMVTYQGNVYITTGNVCPANIFNPTFESISSNVRVVDLAEGNITLLQTLTLSNLQGNINSLAMSSDKQWLFVGGNNRVETYTTTNSNWANLNYTLANTVTGPRSFGNTITIVPSGEQIFISAPQATNVYDQNGNVYYYHRTNTSVDLVQTISSQFKNNLALFGSGVGVDSTAGNLFIGSPGSNSTGFPQGEVEHWVFDGNSYNYQSTLYCPDTEFNKIGLHRTQFGSVLGVSHDAKVLAVGSRGSASEETTIFDNSSTVIDRNSTKFIDSIIDSGSVYMFEPLINLADTAEISYSFVQELETGPNDQLSTGDNFGSTIKVFRDIIFVGADGTDSNAGAVYTFANPTQTPAWVLNRQQQPKVNIDSVNRTFIYNKTNNDIIAAVDIVDPAKGKILTTVAGDIDYQLEFDPAVYNAGTAEIHTDYHWGPDQVGRIWWDLSSVRYIDYEQDELIYRLNHWGETFPGSQINIYEWVESTVLPSEFVSSGQSGIPLYADNSSYSTYGYVDQAGTVRLKYYFWVTGREQANSRAGKQNSVIAITSAIENPQNQNLPYAAILRNDTVSLYNIKNLLIGQNSVLHLGSQSADAGLIHSEYALVQEKSAGSEIPVSLLNKLIDSLAGTDQAGNLVPDPALPVSQRYGTEIRPRQTLFVDRTIAFDNYITLVNKKLLAYPVTQRKILTTLLSGEPEPSLLRDVHDLVVASKAELDYIDTNAIMDGFCALVQSDITQQGKWVIYNWNEMDQEWMIHTRDDGSEWIQSYKTDLYWTYQDWFDSSFDPSTVVDTTVGTNLDFGKLVLEPDTYIKVLNAGDDKFAIYYINSALERVTVGLEGGTVQINTGSIPSKELRQILLSMQKEIFIDDLAQDFNQIFFAMIKYALTEQKNLDWVFKTSFISATQFIRKLEQFPSYIADNQDFYQDYINEVKPYRTILREFNINYQRDDEYSGDMTDFDLAPYWDSNINVYRSPSGEQSYDSELLNNQVYRDWKNNYAYQVVDVVVGQSGSGFITAPQIVISGGGGSGATAISQINEFGGLASVTIVNPGSGYTSQPTVVINGTGTGAVATAVLRNVFDGNDTGHNVVRSIRTNLKFDRVTYSNPNTFVFWDNITSADAGKIIPANTIVVLDNVLYKMISANTISPSVQFPSANVIAISNTDFDNANDRIVAYNGNIDLSATAEGIDYPGVVVDGDTYFAYDSIIPWTPNTTINAGLQISYSGNIYVVGTYDVDQGQYTLSNPTRTVNAPYFANIEANVTQVTGAKIDSIIQSRFSDNLGINAGDIYVDGGAYIDTFSSHAPEELIPGTMYDSVNIQVFGNTAPNSVDYSFRLFDDMNQTHSFYRISQDTTTSLVSDLLITDDKIVVEDSSKLPIPNRYLGIPGVIFINGEKITYYRNYSQENITPWLSNTVIADDSITTFNGNFYLTTGNVFATSVPWQPNTVFATDSYLYYSGNSYQITGNVNAPQFGDIVANTRLLYNNEESGFASITSNLTLIGDNINVLGQLRRAVDGTAPNSLNVLPWTVNTAHPVGTYITHRGNTYVSTGNIYNYDVLWRANTVFETNSYFYYGGNVYQATGNAYTSINGTFANVISNVTLVYSGRTDSGFVSASGNLNYLYSDSVNLRHLAGTRVVDSSQQQQVPDIDVNVVVVPSTYTFVAADKVTLKLQLTTSISANAGSYINQLFANTTVAANVRVLETTINSSNIAVLPITGAITNLLGNTITIDGTVANANVVSSTQLGSINANGTVVVNPASIIANTTVWTDVYSTVGTSPNIGNISVSTTNQSEFLKLSPGYVP
jgi:hypothetical protein